jgi:hypothetical protein
MPAKKTAPSSGRVRRVLKVVDDLALDPQELLALRAELETRQGCVIDLGACSGPEERKLAQAIKQRIDAVARGDAKLVPISDILRGAATRSARRKRAAGREDVHAHDATVLHEVQEAVVTAVAAGAATSP